MTERNLTQLVNDKRMRPAFKRLFDGNAGQIVGELLQNAARAGAKLLEFTTFVSDNDGLPSEIHVRDNGTGILDGINGWHTMLSIADSAYQDENVQMQDPLGVGLHALFASSQVFRVTLRSHDMKIVIDTKRWWTDHDYYSTWVERLLDDRESQIDGLELHISCTKKFVEATIRSLTLQETAYLGPKELPARGYEGVLDITMNDAPVDTSVLARFTHPKSQLIWEGDYEGNWLKIGDGTSSCINWYGQAIEDRSMISGFSYYFQVRYGTPLDLKSPTREGVIDNDKHAALKQFIIDRIFEAVNGASIQDVRLNWVRGLYQLDCERAMREARYYIAGKINNTANAAISSYEDLVQIKEEIKEYGRGDLLLINRDITVEDLGGNKFEAIDEWHGIESFVEDLRRVYGEPYELIAGNTEKLRILDLVWRPDNIGEGIFVDPGVYTLRKRNQSTQEWHTLTGDVFAFESTTPYSIDSCYLHVAARDRYQWLRSSNPWAVFDAEGADDSYETCRAQFDQSILDVIVSQFPDMLAEPFSLLELSRRMNDDRISNIEIMWLENERPRLRITAESGQVKELMVI